MNLTIDGPFISMSKEAQITKVSEGTFLIKTSSIGGCVSIDISNCSPEVWSVYDYLTAEVYHECHDVLVIILKFKDINNRSISIHYGVLPHVKTRLCLPLEALNGEKLFLDRFPGILQSVLRGDSFVDRRNIDHFSISTIPSVSARQFEVSNLRLTSSEPEFNYEPTIYIDELGQISWKEWKGKTRSLQEMESALTEDLHRLRLVSDQSDSEIGPFGGWKKRQFKSTGFFRTEFDGSNWWFVDPDGYALFSTGIDCIGPHSEMRITGMEHLLPTLPDKHGAFQDAWSEHGHSHTTANLIRVFGEQWRERWNELTELRLYDWGLNTIGNWSDPEFIRISKLPYVYPMTGFPTTKATIYRDFPDVFSLEYEENASEFAKQLDRLREDKRLIGYFMRNEPHWAFVDGLNLTVEMLRNPTPFSSKNRFITWLQEKYGSVERWNMAWGTSHEEFGDLLDCRKATVDGNLEWLNDCAAFNRTMIRRYVEIPAKYCKEVDPHHLNLGMRYAWISNDDILEGCEAFDVFSINCYQFEPDRTLIERISKKLNRPVMIGEYHFGAADTGMLAYGIRAVATQQDRGLAYRYYVEQAAAIPGLIGVHYFQLNDQAVLGRFDGENYQIGVVDVCQRPYQAFVEQMKIAHRNMYEIRTGYREPLREHPVEIPKTGF